MAVLVADNLQKTYVSGDARVAALAGVSFEVESGDFVALMGPSGCGKSTLLHLCGAMDRLTSGTLRLNDRDLSTMGDDELTRVRREQVGFVFQFFNLLPTLTVADNIALPCLLAGMKDQDAERRARALAHQPALLVADEPTGNLDSENGANVLRLIAQLNKELNVTVLLATHADDVAAAASRVLKLKDGKF